MRLLQRCSPPSSPSGFPLLKVLGKAVSSLSAASAAAGFGELLRQGADLLLSLWLIVVRSGSVFSYETEHFLTLQ